MKDDSGRRWCDCFPAVASSFLSVLLSLPSTSLAADFDCVMQPRQMLEIRSPIEGLVDRVVVVRGQYVRKGQELAFVDSSVERLNAEAAKYRAEMLGATRAAQSKVTMTNRKLGRVRELVKSDFLAIQAEDDARNEKQIAEAELREAVDNRNLAEIEYRRQMTIIDLKTIRSPVNGVVTEVVLNPGELAEAGVGRKPILKVAEVDVLHVDALLPAEVYRQVSLGMAAEVIPAVSDARPERSAITVIDPVMDPGSGTFGVRLEVPNPRRTLLAGTRCTLRLPAVTVPPPPAPARKKSARASDPPARAATGTPPAASGAAPSSGATQPPP
jgi:RND family efflux transporter MFP subunit